MIEDFHQHRWDRATRPAELKPEEALIAATRDAPEFEPEHIIILAGKVCEDGSIHTRLYQAGKFNDYEQLGMFAHARHTHTET